MNKIYRSITLVALVFMFVGQGYAHLPVGSKSKKKAVKENRAVGCLRPTAYNFLTINNVKSRINTAGNMWYPPGESIPQYFVPANSGKTSLFSGAIWVGGVDFNGQLKIAAQTFASGGVNYWTGPLTTDGTAAVSKSTCAKYDKHWVITKAEVNLFRAWFNSKNQAEEFPNYKVPEVILNWPAHGNTNLKQSYYLAPFVDVNEDGVYNPLEGGDYPYYDFNNDLCPNKGANDYVPEPTPDTTLQGGSLVDQVLKGDQTIWWVMNDKGDAHAAPDGEAIGLEMRSQAFAFATNDEINNMTFFSYEIINRSTYTLTQTYFAPWTDPDLGFAEDDYVGCDVGRGLGYCYNGKDVDGSGQPNAYGDQPPAVGIDFFQGPYMDPDRMDNPKYITDTTGGEPVDVQVVDASINGVNFENGIVDDERFGMRRFVYYNNSHAQNGDPKSPSDYYNYLRGIWKNNARMQYGGDGFTTNTVGPAADFMFPGDSDPWNWGTGGNPPGGGYNQNGKYWTEEEVGNPPGDRRFVQSAGPFTLEPGAVNYITFGIPWARATSGGASASVALLRVVDDKCQALFDNCFKILDGPDAPDVTIKEYDKQLVLMLSNDPITSNNYQESYDEIDVTIVRPEGVPAATFDSSYTFEGYQIFQLKDKDVSVGGLHDPEQARLVAQCDIKNGVSTLVNYNYNETMGASVPVVEVDGSNRGIKNTFLITEDAFATGNKALVNNKQYYYLALAYSYNQYAPYSVDPGNPEGLLGQTKPYLAGRRNIKVYTAMPHQNLAGVQLNAKYGDQPQITKLEGKGNGGLFTKFTQATIDDIMSKSPSDTNNRLGNPDYPIAYKPVYEPGAGPLAVKVVDPLSVKNIDFELRLDSLYPRYRTKLTGYGGLIVDGQHAITDTATMWVSRWHLKDLTNDKEYSADTAIITPIDRVFPEYGLAINMEQVYQPGKYEVGFYKKFGNPVSYKVVLANKNGYVSSSIAFDDNSGLKNWLTGISDTDDGSYADWVRAGVDKDDVPPAGADSPASLKYDPDGIYEHVIEGTWAPMMLATDIKRDGPAIYENSTKWHGKFDVSMHNLSGVRVVFTSDKSKWTRSPVMEMQTNPSLAEGNAKLFTLRQSPSIDKDGNFAQPGSGVSDNPMEANYISDTGMGWFPGYAIDLETGERLNIIYGEDSWLSDQNGRDMQWNPTSNVLDPISGEVVMGGKHFIYLMKTGYSRKLSKVIKREIIFPAYDAGSSVKALDDLAKEKTNIAPFIKKGLVSMISWTSMPLLADKHQLLETDVTIDINIGKPYARYLTYNNPLSDSLEQGHLNDNYPLYTFSTGNMVPGESKDENVIENALSEIKVVPNPYYAYSAYETKPLDNRVRITNLPSNCEISIYNLAGVQVRHFNKNNSDTYYDWDLKNFAGVQIAGGMYVIYVKAVINGKKYDHVVKWLGMMRKPDMNSF